MAFLIERIPDEEKAKLSEELDDYNPDLSSRWAIDRERNAYVAIKNKVGGPYEGTQITEYYVLSWGGKLIHITADPLKPSFNEKGVTMNWRVEALRIPRELQDKNEDVMRLVKDAFTSIGQSFDGDRYLAVNVDFRLSGELH